MNHILKRFLINIFLYSFIFSSDFESWMNQKKEIINNNIIVQLSLKISQFEINDFNNKKASNEDCYLIINSSDSIYQIKYLNNLIYYDKVLVQQYNINSKQLFKYSPDDIIINYLDNSLLSHLFEFSNYTRITPNQYMFDSESMKLDNIYLNYLDSDGVEVINDNFISDIYKISFNNIEIKVLTPDEFEKLLLVNIDDIIDIFDFTK